jgi:hypothetical protein
MIYHQSHTFSYIASELITLSYIDDIAIKSNEKNKKVRKYTTKNQCKVLISDEKEFNSKKRLIKKKIQKKNTAE